MGDNDGDGGVGIIIEPKDDCRTRMASLLGGANGAFGMIKGWAGT